MDFNINVNYSVDFEVLDNFLQSAKQHQNGFVMYDTPYALYVEYPTEYSDKKPPLADILAWVKRNITTDKPKQTAFRIQEHIFQNGTEGVFYLNRTKKNIETQGQSIIDSYNGNIEDAPENIMRELLQKIEQDSGEIINNEAFDTGRLQDSTIIELTEDSDLVE